MVVSYENAKIYKIIGPNVTDPCYVGSTTNKYLSQRKSKHVEHYKLWLKSEDKKKHRKVMSYDLFDQHGPENCHIILLETVNVTSKDELRKKEQEYIDKLVCVNKQRAYCTTEDNKATKRKWLDNNKDTLAAKRKVYNEVNKDKNKLYHQNYQQENKEAVAANKKAYAEAHKAERKVYSEKTYFCESCKCDVKLIRKSRHITQAKHLAKIKA